MHKQHKREVASMRVKIFNNEQPVHEIKGDELGVRKQFEAFFKQKYK